MKNILKMLIVFIMVFNLFGCEKQKEEGIYKTALEDIKNGNTQAAIENLEKLVTKNPYSEFAPDAFFTLASLYQTLEGDSIQKIKNFEQALAYYNELIEKFPNNQKTPEAIFMAGFICAENLKDYKRAEYYYKKFLKAYPDHELASSVKVELDNLGKSPEEILKEKGVDLGDKGKSK
ncbi:MAG: tetratricopeptide repeat protein [Ignavibacteria bacterium]|jgi:outer membrane protein assembly factor BamD (BamD/ComL family)